jgi:hypothetical protein
LNAVTLQKYATPLLSPEMTIGDALRERLICVPSSVDVHVARYRVIGLPPFELGGLNPTVIRPSPPATEGRGGAPGTPLGTAARDATDAGPLPRPFDARTVHVYDFPFVSPNTVIDGLPPIWLVDTAPDVQVAVSLVIALPFAAGWMKFTRIWESPAVTVGRTGASGTWPAGLGVTAFDGSDSGPSPLLLCAKTVHVYVSPLVKPRKENGVTVVVLLRMSVPSLCAVHVIVYFVMARPPLEAGAENVTVTRASPAAIVGAGGAPGTVGATGVAALDASDGGLWPSLFEAITVHVYECPLSSPETTMVRVVSEAVPEPPPSVDVQVAA